MPVHVHESMAQHVATGLSSCHCLMMNGQVWSDSPLSAAASPLAVHVRIHFCLMAGPCNAFPAAASLSDIHEVIIRGKRPREKQTKPSFPSFLCSSLQLTEDQKKILTEENMQLLLGGENRLNYEMMQRKGRLRRLVVRSWFFCNIDDSNDRSQFISLLLVLYYHRMLFNNLQR